MQTYMPKIELDKRIVIRVSVDEMRQLKLRAMADNTNVSNLFRKLAGLTEKKWGRPEKKD